MFLSFNVQLLQEERELRDVKTAVNGLVEVFKVGIRVLFFSHPVPEPYLVSPRTIYDEFPKFIVQSKFSMQKYLGPLTDSTKCNFPLAD